LRGMVEYCNTQLNLGMFPEEVTSVAAVLQRDFYRFARSTPIQKEEPLPCRCRVMFRAGGSGTVRPAGTAPAASCAGSRRP
jgi:hypothetical protein